MMIPVAVTVDQRTGGYESRSGHARDKAGQASVIGQLDKSRGKVRSMGNTAAAI